MAELTAQQEAALAAFVEGMYGVWLPQVEAAVLSGYLRFGIRPDPAAVTATTEVWRQQVARFLAELQRVGAQAYEEEAGVPMSTGTMITAAAAAATVVFLMAQVGEVQASLFQIVATGGNNADVTAKIRAFLAPSAGHWSSKAATVAQTEGDRWAQAATLSAGFYLERVEGRRYEKTWHSRDDLLVRPAHAAADGQARPLNATFNVGGYPMMYPKDPTAPPQLVVNCRCGMRIRPMGGDRA